MSISIDLDGQVAIVTGGGSGIGAAIAHTLANAGATVAIADISLDAGQRVAKDIEAGGGRAIAVAVDVSDRASAQAGVDEVRAQLGRIDHLVNNAAVWEIKKVLDHTPAEVDRIVGITLTGTMTMTAVALPHIIEAKGSVVAISSDSARSGESHMSYYAGAKAGVIGFAKSVAKEVGRKGVRVNVVAPGTTATPGASAFIDQVGADKLAKAYPLGRLGEPQDIANAVLFLVSPLSSWITGQVLSVSGGFSMH